MMSQTKIRRSTAGNSYPFEELTSEDGLQYLDYLTRLPPVLDGTGRLAEDFHLQTEMYREVWKAGGRPPVTAKSRKISMERWTEENDRRKKANEKAGAKVEVVGSPTPVNGSKVRRRQVRESKPPPEPGTETPKQEYRRRFMVAWKADGNKAGPEVAKFKTDWKLEHPRGKSA